MVIDIPFHDALKVWWRIGLLSFGGPAGQIALMHRIIVDEKRWLDEARFLHALNYCMLLPGPEAQQLATYIGWLMHGVRGGLVAGLLFIMPGAFAILVLSWFYVLLGDFDVVEGLFFGLKAAVLAIVVQALLRIATRTLYGKLKPLLAVAAFVGLFVFNLPFPLVIMIAGVTGYLFAYSNHQSDIHVVGSDRISEVQVRPGTTTTAFICLLLWGGTVAGFYAVLGVENVFTQLATFFSQMAVVTFGGAYAVLSYVAQQGVENYHWIKPGEMLDGLGLAETTPGPLILVTQFVGFLAAFRTAGFESPLLAATLGAGLTTWVTFLPCFVWIFAGAPYVEKLRSNKAISAALSAITAAVVGVIANLALWFALNSLFKVHTRITTNGLDLLIPDLSSLDLPMLLLSCFAFLLVFGFRLKITSVLGLCALAAMLWTLSN
jgi:chromate transporter